MQGEQLHPAGVDLDQWPVGARRQAGHRPVEALGRARERDAGFAVEAEDVEDVLSLPAAEEFLEAAGIFEPLFKGVGVSALAVLRCCFVLYPRALLLVLEKLE